MSIKELQKMYKETQTSITRMLDKGKLVDKKLIENQLKLINEDISSKDEGVKKAALSMLEFLVNSNCKNVQAEIINQLNGTAFNESIQSLFIKSLRKKISNNIMKCQNFCEILQPWQNQNTTMLINTLEEICLNNLPRDKCKLFFINEVIPTMMCTDTDEKVRDILSDIAFILCTAVPVSDLTSVELALFLEEVSNKYITAISNLRDKDQSNWHNLWIFLVRFCNKKIHNSMELTNRLLRVVEFAFRSSSVQQRLRGYDCWKELIDNASLDSDYICSSKQIKLLVTPLRAKFSKQEIVISKRFDVFAYLLEKLRHKSVLCLREFLEFCFGPLGDNKDESRTGQGRGVLEVRLKSTKVLMEIIGHSHEKNIDCLVTQNSINLENPLINHDNFATFYQFIINSVAQCCILLRESDIESKRMQVIKCMWKSVFNFIVPPSEKRLKYFQLLANILDDYIIKSGEHLYFEDLLGLIFTLLISFDKDSNNQIHDWVQSILKQLITIYFTVGNISPGVSENFKKIISHSFSQIMLKEDKLKMIEVIMKCFSSIKAREECASNVAKVWLCLNSELISDLAADKIEEFGKFREYFFWPAHNLHFLDEKSKKQIVVHWMKLYRKLSSESEDKKLVVMKHLEIIFKNNPLHASDVVSLLNVMSQFETKFTREFVTKLMEVSSSILLLPNLHTEDEQKISALVIQYFEPSLECYKTEDNDEVIKVICTSIEHILCIHEGFKLLEPLANFIRNCSKDMRGKFSKYLESLLLDLYTKENDVKSYNAKELSKVLGIFTEKDSKEDKKTFVIPSGRSARIANLAKNSPKTPSHQKTVAPGSPAALRLFGKDPETMSPLRARGSQLNNSTPTKLKRISTPPRNKTMSTPSINEEDSSDFVKIDTEVKFQPSKLNEHQKEIMGKRREDIPALYQDLSQSLSQDYFSSKSNSKDAVNAKDTNKSTGVNAKVIVEKIESNIFSLEGNEKHAWGTLEPEDAQKLKIDTEIPENEKPIPMASKEVPRAEDTNEKINSESDMFPEDIKDLPLKNNKSAEIITRSVEENLKMNEQPNDTDAEFKGFEGGQPVNSDLISQFSKHGEKNEDQGTISEDLFSEGSSAQLPREDMKDIKLGVSGIENEEKPNGKKKKKIDAELERLKMDIVGADKFFEARRRTRPKEKPKKFEEVVGVGKKAKTSPPEGSATVGKKIKTSPTDKTLPGDKKVKTSPTENRRMSINFNKPEMVIEKNRRKTIGVIHKSDLKEFPSSSEEMKSQGPRKSKESTDDAKTIEFKNNLGSHDTPQQKSKDQKTPLVKRKSIKLQKIETVEESEKVLKSNKAEQQKLIEQDTPVRNKRKSMKLLDDNVTTYIEMGSAPEHPKTNEYKTPVGKKQFLKAQEVNSTADLEIVHMKKEVDDQNVQKTLAKRRSTKLQEDALDNEKKILTEPRESDQKMQKEHEISSNSVDDIAFKDVNVTEGVQLFPTNEEASQEIEKDSNSIEGEKQTMKLQENHLADDSKMAAKTNGDDLQEPLVQEVPVDKKHLMKLFEEVEDQEMYVVSRQMQVDQYETNEQTTERNMKLQDVETNSGATFTIATKKSSRMSENPVEGKIVVTSEPPSQENVVLRAEEEESKEEQTEFAIRKKNETSTIDDETPDIFLEGRGEKRKHSTDDDEDFIESSQESFAEVTSMKKKLLRLSMEQNTSSDEHTVVQQKTVTAADFISDIEITKKKCIEIIEETEVFQKDFQVEDKIENKQNIIEDKCMEKTIKETEQSTEHIDEIPDKIEPFNIYNLGTLGVIKLSEVPIQTEKTVSVGEAYCQPIGTLEDTDSVLSDNSKEANTTQDTTLTQETSQDLSQFQDSTQDSFQTEENIQAQVATQDTLTQPTPTQETPTQQDLCSVIEDNVPPTLYFDLPKKPNLTESEQMMCRMDTMSICVAKDDILLMENRPEDRQSMEEIELMATAAVDCLEKENIASEETVATPSTNSAPSSPNSFSSPNRSNSLPSSPITVDTPTRTSKLLDDTMDISPIASNNSSPESGMSTEIPVPTRLFFLDEVQELGEMETMMKLDKEAGDKQVPWKADVNGGNTSSDDSDGIQSDLHTVPTGKYPLSNGNIGPEFEAVQQDDNVSGRYDNDVDNEESAQIQNGTGSRNSLKDLSTIQERSSKLLNMINVNSPIPHNQFFRRRLGGSTSSPSGGRIMKLMSNFCPKQTTDLAEEISEDDILTFSREIPSPLAVPKSSILKRKFSDTGDLETISPCAKRKRVNFSDPCLTSKKLFIKDEFLPTLEAKRLFDPVPEPKLDGEIRDIFDISDKVGSLDQMTETENIETEPSLDIINPMILRKDRPIYPKLVDCKEDLLVILKRITSPIFITTLTNKLKSKNIRTIGDLAQQSEAEINRFPFKVPVVANVFKALDSYYKKKGGILIGESGAERSVNGIRESHKKEVAGEASKTGIPKVDVTSELKILMQRATKENYPIEDLAKILLRSLDKQKLTSLVTDFLEETDNNTVSKHISEHKTLSEVPNRIRESCYEDQTDYTSSAVPLEKLLRGRDMKEIIEVCIQQNHSSKKEVLENCLLPLIESPNDISSYLNSLSMVDFRNIVLEKLQTENLGTFLGWIKESFPQNFFKTACDICLVSPEDIATSFQSAVESCSDDKKTQIIKLISEKFDRITLVSLHMQFLNRMLMSPKE